MAKLNDQDRRALVTYVISRVGDTNPIGKKATQKFVHLIEDAAKVPTGFDFSIYTYGPFSRTLANELNNLDSLKAISVTYNASRSSFEIGPGINAQKVIADGGKYLEDNKSRIDAVIDRLKGKSGIDLELYSTLVFLIVHVSELKSDEQIITQLLNLKPKYNRFQVERTLEDARTLLQ